MQGKRVAWSVWLALWLAGCSGPVGVYHSIEGGAIAQDRAPPPGADAPYPNLADVPAAPVPLTPAQQAAAEARASGAGVSPPSQQALDGLDLPGAPPPPPGIEAAPPPAAVPAAPMPAPAPAAPPPPGPAVLFAFPPHSAILPESELSALQKFVNGWTGEKIEAGGFGDDGSLPLALARAQRLADALTADHVPASAIKLTAQADRHGGFVRFTY